MRGETLIGFSRAVREACGVIPGEEIEARVVLDDVPREVEVRRVSQTLTMLAENRTR